MAKNNPPFGRGPALVILLSTILLTACEQGPRDPVQPAVDLDVRIERLDQDLFHHATDTATNLNLRLYALYGPFYKEYVERILRLAPVEDPRLPVALSGFALNPDWNALQQRADSILGDMDVQRAGFEEAFERLLVFFPDSLVPRIIAFNSGFNYGVTPTDSVLGIGVEWFIAHGSSVEALLAPDIFPQYMKERMVPDMLVPSAVKGWLQVHYTRDVRGEDVLTNLVEIGKVMYLLDAVLPGTNPAFKFAFTDEQLKWCEDNEFKIWKELIGKEQLYSKKTEDIDRLLNDGPFTNGFPRESPGHIGEWIGFRMVNAYMRDHDEITMAQLFANTDPRTVLKSYKPR